MLPSCRELRDIIEWDVANWKRALCFWEPFLPQDTDVQLLDIGAGHGGLSLYFALKGYDVVCTDLDGPPQRATERHEAYGVSHRIQYRALDATDMDLPDDTFDLMCFKSVLGGIGWDDDISAQQRAMREMHRVLKPGGRLLFAENLTASPLHAWLRRRFVGWGQRWRYVTLEEMREFCAPFRALHLTCYGVVAAFGRTESQRTLLHGVDRLLSPLVPDRWKYIVFGCAVK